MCGKKKRKTPLKDKELFSTVPSISGIMYYFLACSLLMLTTLNVKLVQCEPRELPDEFKKHSVAARNRMSDISDPEQHLKKMMVKWLHAIDENGIQEECSVIYGQSRYNESAVMVREVKCSEPGATKDYSFSGETIES